MVSSDDVARYLQANPKFFEEYADLLAQLYVPHPHGGRAISITERQILSLREKSRGLEHKLAELIRFGEENDAIGAKVHRLGLALIAASGLDAALRAAYAHLVEDFAVPHVAVRIWDAAPADSGVEFAPVPDELRAAVLALAHPYCGPANLPHIASLFGEAGNQVRSVAVVPLAGDSGCMGMLALASEDARRFYAEMGTLFLGRIGEMVAAAISRKLG
ncbi:MAG: DUF484 family protein [Rhodocyclaceae bacterium]|nr:DUF484 family protein [Rhodocyclaceae bacterium]MBX3670059.1 DUF484 family protein [Rhodocyclaceae bacterium]